MRPTSSDLDELFCPSDRQMPTLDEGLGLLNGFLAELTDRQPVIVGNSLGAWLGWRYLLRYPESIAGCLMLAPGGFMRPDELGRVVERFCRASRTK